MRRLLPLTAILLCTAATAVATGQEDDSRQPQGSSVGDGNGAAPAIATEVRRAARRGRCQVRSFASEGRAHGLGSLTFPQTPPVSGTHASRWADWGAYDEPVPHSYQVHNLEHGGVVVHYAGGLPGRAAEGIGRFLGTEPGFVVLTPRVSRALVPREGRLRSFPARGFVATSWQRRLVCRRASGRAVAALRTYVRSYRGAGPEQIASVNSSQPRPDDLPAPAVPTR